MMSNSQTLIDKLWAMHEIVRRDDGASLLWVDRHYVHEGSFHAFSQMKGRGRSVAEPQLTFGVADHYVPTRGRASGIANPEIAAMVRNLEANTGDNHITLFGLRDPRQGIVHVVGPEQGLTLPGLLIVCGDSHTSTHGAFGAYAFGIGASEVAHVLMTQTLWQKKPKRMRITVDGTLAAGIAAKDIALAIIARIRADGAQGHAIEFAGSAIRALSMEGRLTLCNMSIEAGGRCGMVAPDATTFAYLKGRPFAPKGSDFDRAVEAWSALTSDADASFDREVSLNASEIAPIVTWGTTPGRCIAGRRPRSRSRARERPDARQISARGARLYGARAGNEADRHRGRPGVHRLVHQFTHRGSARGGGRAQRPRQQGARPGLAGLVVGETAGRGRRPRQDFPRRRPRVGRFRLLDVRRHQWRPGAVGRALRLDHQPEFPRPAGTGRAHASDVAGHGGGSRRQRPSRRCPASARRAQSLEAPMDKFVRLTATACPLSLPNLNTDQILPARYLKWPRSKGLGTVLFDDVRLDAKGQPREDFAFNKDAYRGAKVLLAGRNFGGGSSREAAVYALYDHGFRCVVAPSFGDIFSQNAVKNGLLTAVAAEADIEKLAALVREKPSQPVTVDLERQTVSGNGISFAFTIDPISRNQLLNGWDDVDLTESYREQIAAFKAKDKTIRPWAVPLAKQ